MQANWTEAEIRRMVWLRSVEWCNWPVFISALVVPVLLLWITWWKVLLGLFMINALWAIIRHHLHNLRIANFVAVIVTPGQWIVMIVCLVIQLSHKHWWLAILSAAWPFLHGFINFPGGKIGQIEYNFATEIGPKRVKQAD